MRANALAASICITLTALAGYSASGQIGVSKGISHSSSLPGQNTKTDPNAACLFFSPDKLSFGSKPVGAAASMTFKVSNTCRTTVHFKDVKDAEDSTVFHFDSHCGKQVSAHKDCSVTVSLEGKEPGPVTGGVVFYDDYMTGEQTVKFKATLTAAAQ